MTGQVSLNHPLDRRDHLRRARLRRHLLDKLRDQAVGGYRLILPPTRTGPDEVLAPGRDVANAPLVVRCEVVREPALEVQVPCRARASRFARGGSVAAVRIVARAVVWIVVEPIEPRHRLVHPLFIALRAIEPTPNHPRDVPEPRPPALRALGYALVHDGFEIRDDLVFVQAGTRLRHGQAQKAVVKLDPLADVRFPGQRAGRVVDAPSLELVSAYRGAFGRRRPEAGEDRLDLGRARPAGERRSSDVSSGRREVAGPPREDFDLAGRHLDHLLLDYGAIGEEELEPGPGR